MKDLTDIETEAVPSCLLCGGDGGSDKSFAARLALRPPFDVKRCRSCDFRWLSPRPTEQGYSALYSWASYFDGPDAVEYYPDLAASRFPYFKKRLAYIETLLECSAKLRVLDIGAATGEFVAAASGRGHEATGLELSEGAIAEARKIHGIELRNEPVEEHLSNARYDVIHMNHVLEHMPHPAEIASAIANSLSPGGIWAIEVPQQFLNDLDRIRYAIGMRKPEFNVYSLHHTSFFRMRHLKKLVEDAGLEVVVARTANAWRTPLQPFSWRNAVLRVFLGLADALHGGGNILEIYARKPR